MAAQIVTRSGSAAGEPQSEYRRKQADWQHELGEAMAQSVGKYLEGRGQLNKPISSLQLCELEGIAWAAVSEYQNRREAMRRQLLSEGRNMEAESLKDKLDSLLGA